MPETALQTLLAEFRRQNWRYFGEELARRLALAAEVEAMAKELEAACEVLHPDLASGYIAQHSVRADRNLDRHATTLYAALTRARKEWKP